MGVLNVLAITLSISENTESVQTDLPKLMPSFDLCSILGSKEFKSSMSNKYCMFLAKILGLICMIFIGVLVKSNFYE